MLSETEALERVLSHMQPGPAEATPLLAALNHFAAAPVIASVPLPGFDNSMVDGYAVPAAAGKGSRLPVMGEQPAGLDLGLQVPERAAVRIFTGAPLPAGTHAVIMQEDVIRDDDGILMTEAVEPGENIRRAGSDLCQGQIIVQPGVRLGAVQLGVLASQGLDKVQVHRRPRLGILSTGDELIPPGLPLARGQLYNSNAVMLAALAAQLGGLEAQCLHAPDTLPATVQALQQLSDTCDVIVVSGGVSVGDHDHVKPALSQLGMPPDLWRVKLKPGKPFLYAHQSGSRPLHVFGLPGNPVSSFISWQLFVRPALLRLMGAGMSYLPLPQVKALVQQEIRNPGDRPHYIRGRLSDNVFHPFGPQQSHALYSLSQCNALLRVPEETIFQVNENCAVLALNM